jgi:HPt (histidine-containing phosphotransfer) domain-containing protein
VEKLQQAVRNPEGYDFRGSLHAIKNSLINVHAQALAERAADLEQHAALNSVTPEFIQSIEILMSDIDQAQTALGSWLTSGSQAPGLTLVSER